MIYFIGTDWDSPVKIGFTMRDPNGRLRSLQTGNPYKLRILCVLTGYEDLESFLHNKFSDHRLQGEWFNGQPVKDFIDRMADGLADKEIAPYLNASDDDEGLWFKVMAFIENSNEYAKRYKIKPLPCLLKY